MSRLNPGSLLDSLVGAAISLLLAAVALSIAVRLIEAVWVLLVVIGAVVIVGTLILTIIRQRGHGGW